MAQTKPIRIGITWGDPHGIGSRITVETEDKTQTRWIHSMGRSMLVSVPYDAHFGLGTEETVTITVDWLDGSQSEYSGVSVNQTLVAYHP